MKKTIKTALAVGIPMMMAGVANAAVIITDSGFDSALTDIGTTLTHADSANFDKWVYRSVYHSQWDQESTGGNTGGYADGTYINSTVKRTMYQVMTDDKATTGTVNLTFDLNMVGAPGTTFNEFYAHVWGVTDSGSGNFSLRTDDQAGATNGDAIILSTQEFTADTTGWENQSLEVDLGTGYDLVIVGFYSRHFKNGTDTLGIDNVAMASAVPEPTSTALLGLGGLALILRRRR